MTNTYFKTLWRMFRKHITRLLSIIFMVLVTVGFVSGLGSATDKINASLTEYYKEYEVSDFIIKNTTQEGFSKRDVEEVEKLFDGAKVNLGASYDLPVEGNEKRYIRYYFVDFDNWTVNVPQVTDGDFLNVKNNPQTLIFSERGDDVIKETNVGDTVTIDYKSFIRTLYLQTDPEGSRLDELEFALEFNFYEKESEISLNVGAVVQSPLTFAFGGEPSYYNDAEDMEFTTTGTENLNCLESIYYLSDELISGEMLEDFFPKSDIYVSVSDKNIFNNFSQKYRTFTDEGTEKIKAALKNAEVITLYDNYSFKSLSEYSTKVESIGYVLMCAFLLVTGLVVLSTMTRLLEEERSQIACLKTLGYSSIGIISKYLVFALIGTGIGALGSYFVGLGLAYLIYYVFNYSFAMPPVSDNVAIVFYLITIGLIIVTTLLATFIAGEKLANEKPANLLRPKPPRSGKKVILEKVPFIWNRLPFRYKSTVRNVLRYKSRFFMTVISVAISMALVFAGAGLVDLCMTGDFGSSAIIGIGFVVLAFAGLLTAVVIYTLTNINISERNREIATLMVLGYQDKEVTGYIFREIYITTFIGIIFGYPLSVLILKLVFSVMEHGSYAELSWFLWIMCPLIVLAFTFVVTLALRRKIVKIDMNESLKAIE